MINQLFKKQRPDNALKLFFMAYVTDRLLMVAVSNTTALYNQYAYGINAYSSRYPRFYKKNELDLLLRDHMHASNNAGYVNLDTNTWHRLK
jgi:hypothetical protein